jgi:hypothetical protein
MKLFIGSTYNVKHSEINEENVLQKLNDDIRSKLIGTKEFVYGGERIFLKDYPNIEYVGGFYYEETPTDFVSKNSVDYIVEAELRAIEKADIVVIVLNKYSAIATISEMLFAASYKKQTYIICNPNITWFEVQGEYWFPITTAQRENPDKTEVLSVENQEQLMETLKNIFGGTKNDENCS